MIRGRLEIRRDLAEWAPQVVSHVFDDSLDEEGNRLRYGPPTRHYSNLEVTPLGDLLDDLRLDVLRARSGRKAMIYYSPDEPERTTLADGDMWVNTRQGKNEVNVWRDKAWRPAVSQGVTRIFANPPVWRAPVAPVRVPRRRWWLLWLGKR